MIVSFWTIAPLQIVWFLGLFVPGHFWSLFSPVVLGRDKAQGNRAHHTMHVCLCFICVLSVPLCDKMALCCVQLCYLAAFG